MIERIKFLLWKMKSRELKYSKYYALKDKNGRIKELQGAADKVIDVDKKAIASICKRLSDVVGCYVDSDNYQAEEYMIRMAKDIIYIAERVQSTRRERKGKCYDLRHNHNNGSKHHID